MTVDTTLEKTGAKDAQLDTAGWIGSCFLFLSAAPSTLSYFCVSLFYEITGITRQMLMCASTAVSFSRLFFYGALLQSCQYCTAAASLSPSHDANIT